MPNGKEYKGTCSRDYAWRKTQKDQSEKLVLALLKYHKDRHTKWLDAQNINNWINYKKDPEHICVYSFFLYYVYVPSKCFTRSYIFC